MLLVLASWRTWMVVAHDDIGDPIRRRLPSKVVEFIECPYCSGFWIGVAWWSAFQFWPHGTLIAAGAVAVTALVPLIDHFTD